MQTIYLDISNKGVVPAIYAKQGDVGRKFLIKLTNNGEVYHIPDGVTFSVWYSGASGEGNYTHIDDTSAFSVSGNAITVELITQMLTNAGDGLLCLVMNGVDGSQLATWNIPYIADAVPGMGSEAAEQYFTAFSEVIKNLPYPDISLTASGKAADAAAVGAALSQKLTATESKDHPGCYYLLNDGVVEWINPPMLEGVEYRTIYRRSGKPEYTKILAPEQCPANESKSIPHGINNVYTIEAEFTWKANEETTKGNAYFVNGVLGAYAWAKAENVGIRSVSVDTTGASVSILLRYTKISD